MPTTEPTETAVEPQPETSDQPITVHGAPRVDDNKRSYTSYVTVAPQDD